MKSKHLGMLALVGAISIPLVMTAGTADAQVGISVGISLPPPIVFAAPPQLVVLPGSYVYVAPDLADDVYFVDGWWWRPWQGHWYRSHSYNTGWSYYDSAPSFYGSVNRDWRSNYRDRRWQGQSWDYERMPEQRVSSNWSSWKSNNYWRSQKNWGVPDRKEHWQGGEPSRARTAPDRERTQQRAYEPAQRSDRQAAPPHAQKMERRPSSSQHGSAPSQTHRQEHGMNRQASQPKSGSLHSQQSAQQPASHGNGESHGHGGKPGGHGQASGHGNGHGK